MWAPNGLPRCDMAHPMQNPVCNDLDVSPFTDSGNCEQRMSIMSATNGELWSGPEKAQQSF